MSACGYQLRCVNYGKRCSNCRHHKEDADCDFLYDSLGVWPPGKHAAHRVEEEEKSQ